MPEVWLVQVVPSEEVRIKPCAPTKTYVEFPKATPEKVLSLKQIGLFPYFGLRHSHVVCAWANEEKERRRIKEREQMKRMCFSNKFGPSPRELKVDRKL